MKKITRIIAYGILTAVIFTGCSKNNDSFSVTMPTAPVESTISVAAIPDISDDFIRGMDVSSVLAEEKSGVKYYDFHGREQDVFKTLAEAGINYARIRIWNNPYDNNGNGYGGGNNDLATAVELGKRASKYGMKVCANFHYSDFWADPKKQKAPKAWEDMSISQKEEELFNYTYESLTTLIDSGVQVSMVQIGNEINNGLAGETGANITRLLIKGSQAVRKAAADRGTDIKIMIHYTEITSADWLYTLIDNHEKEHLDYDVVGFSYYPYWHGDFKNLEQVLKTVRKRYGKTVVVAETAYCYTLKDGDGFTNTIGRQSDLVEGYLATEQGQADMVRDVVFTANEAGVLGVFYWEGAWIPAEKSTWEKYGSGWASSFSGEYDENDAKLYYGGCSFDNQAMFDFNGHPLESLNVWKYLKYGTVNLREF